MQPQLDNRRLIRMISPPRTWPSLFIGRGSNCATYHSAFGLDLKNAEVPRSRSYECCVARNLARFQMISARRWVTQLVKANPNLMLRPLRQALLFAIHTAKLALCSIFTKVGVNYGGLHSRERPDGLLKSHDRNTYRVVLIVKKIKNTQYFKYLESDDGGGRGTGIEHSPPRSCAYQIDM